MVAHRKRKTVGAEEARLLGLLLSGDIAGFEKATGTSMREMELRMRATGELGDDDEPDDDELYFDEDEDEDKIISKTRTTTGGCARSGCTPTA